MPSAGKKLHHFVPRFYLRAWARNEQVFCLQEREIRSNNVRNVGAENYFYRLEKLSSEDAHFIEVAIIQDSPEGLRQSHRGLVYAFTLPHLAKKVLAEAKDAGLKLPEEVDPDIEAYIERQIIELNENYHTSIEDDFQPFLAAMLEGDLSFLSDATKCVDFYRGLAIQYGRTNLFKKSQVPMPRDHYERYLRISNILTHIIANNVAHSLYAGRSGHKILLLDNPTDTPFVTADQPIINLSSHPKEVTPPAKFELYYPISPTKAMMLLEPGSAHTPRSSTVTAEQAHLYNLHMAAHSHRQAYSNSEQELEAIRTELEAFSSCF
jgi:hypothetical protein